MHSQEGSCSSKDTCSGKNRVICNTPGKKSVCQRIAFLRQWLTKFDSFELNIYIRVSQSIYF